MATIPRFELMVPNECEKVTAADKNFNDVILDFLVEKEISTRRYTGVHLAKLQSPFSTERIWLKDGIPCRATINELERFYFDTPLIDAKEFVKSPNGCVYSRSLPTEFVAMLQDSDAQQRYEFNRVTYNEVEFLSELLSAPGKFGFHLQPEKKLRSMQPTATLRERVGLWINTHLPL